MSELISKQTAIDAVMDEFKRIPTNAIRAKIRIEALPPAQPEQHIDEWCYSCKEYDKEKHSCPRWNKVIKNTVDELKSAQPEPCEDAVSRAEVLRMIDCINDHHAITPYKSVGAVTEHLTRIASSLPSVTPEQRTGYWYPVGMAEAVGGESAQWGSAVAYHKCSECDEQALRDDLEEEVLSRWCPHCGVKMISEGKTCDCYRDGTCIGTKEIDSCSCGGVKSKCDFYEHVRWEGDAE